MKWVWRLGLVLVAVLILACSKERRLPEGTTQFLRGHFEAIVEEDGSLRPLFIGRAPVGLCLDAPLTIDTSRWEVELWIGGQGGGVFQAPHTVAGTILCFREEIPADLASTRRLEICGVLRDAFDQRITKLPCIEASYDAENNTYTDAVARVRAFVEGRSERPLEELIAEGDALGRDVRGRDFPFLATHLELVMTHELRSRGSGALLAEAARRLEQLPGWLEHPEAGALATKVALERAAVEMSRGQLRRAWELLSMAEDRARRTGAAQHVLVAQRQADVLVELGALEEPIRRLERVLAECDAWPCSPDLLPDAHNALAWLILLDPDASARHLSLAADSLDLAAEGPYARRVDLQASVWINRALLQSRQGGTVAEVGATVEKARELLGPRPRTGWTGYLFAWADVIEGLAALAAGDAERALELCRPSPENEAFPQLASRAWSCRGQAQRRRGELELARAAFEQSILRHELAAPARLGQKLPTSPGLRADDYYRAARLAVERHAPDEAWRTLTALDRLGDARVSECESADPRQSRERQGELLEQLELLKPPLAPSRRRQLEPLRKSLLQALEELHRGTLAACDGRSGQPTDPADLLAFALPDEVLVLQREGERVELVHRHAVARRDLRHALEALEGGGDGLDDAEWRRRIQPIAEALLGTTVANLGEVTRFALYGVLQRLPLAAVPLGDSRWLAEVTVPVVQPAAARLPEGPTDPATGALFIVDPRRNLPTGDAGRRLYRRIFPEARILFGDQASRRAVRSSIVGSSFLHVDAHGRHDDAFPRLSSLSLSDGKLTWADLEKMGLPRSFANLSGCWTGGSLHTGGRGRYGLGGDMARRGVPWVVVSRSEIDDRLAYDFNAAFYDELARGVGVPSAYASALGELRRTYPASQWSRLILLGGAIAGPQEGAKHDV